MKYMWNKTFIIISLVKNICFAFTRTAKATENEFTFCRIQKNLCLKFTLSLHQCIEMIIAKQISCFYQNDYVTPERM